MDNKPFSVTFIPVFIESPSGKLSAKECHFSEAAVNTINDIYSAVNEKVLTTQYSSRMSEKVRNSIFCCCFEDGFAMFSFGADDGLVSLTGFFIPRRDIRAAWKMFRPQLMYICACPGILTGSNEITAAPREIYSMAQTAKSRLNEEFIHIIEDASEKISGEGVPFSFACTRFPLAALPVYFESRAMGAGVQAQAEDGKIIFERNKINETAGIMRQKFPQSRDLYLSPVPYKTYISARKEELKEELGKAEYKAACRELENDTALQREHLWLFRRAEHSALLDLPFQERLDTPSFEFCILPMGMMQADSMLKIAEENAAAHTEKQKKKGFGLFGFKKQ